jgi:hypothetical protein
MEECTNCGSPVSELFARVYGNNDDVVHGCRSCMRQSDLDHGRAARERATDGTLDVTPRGLAIAEPEDAT